jgi:hypothetical protein
MQAQYSENSPEVTNIVVSLTPQNTGNPVFFRCPILLLSGCLPPFLEKPIRSPFVAGDTIHFVATG